QKEGAAKRFLVPLGGGLEKLKSYPFDVPDLKPKDNNKILFEEAEPVVKKLVGDDPTKIAVWSDTSNGGQLGFIDKPLRNALAKHWVYVKTTFVDAAKYQTVASAGPKEVKAPTD